MAEVTYKEAEPDLRALLREFGPPRKSDHPEQPFWRLQHDGVWTVQAPADIPLKTENDWPDHETSMAPQQQHVDFADLTAADLIVDATYRGGCKGDVTDDPLNKLLPGSGNQGGFRAVAVQGKLGYALVCLYSSLADRDWPDYLDTQAGTFTYYGDNKRPGHRLEDTPRGGNRLLSESFAALHAAPHRRQDVPPFFIFTKGERGRDVVFRGLAAPGPMDSARSTT
jgi:hypothetical protein